MLDLLSYGNELSWILQIEKTATWKVGIKYPVYCGQRFGHLGL